MTVPMLALWNAFVAAPGWIAGHWPAFVGLGLALGGLAVSRWVERRRRAQRDDQTRFGRH